MGITAASHQPQESRDRPERKGRPRPHSGGNGRATSRREGGSARSTGEAWLRLPERERSRERTPPRSLLPQPRERTTLRPRSARSRQAQCAAKEAGIPPLGGIFPLSQTQLWKQTLTARQVHALPHGERACFWGEAFAPAAFTHRGRDTRGAQVRTPGAGASGKTTFLPRGATAPGRRPAPCRGACAELGPWLGAGGSVPRSLTLEPRAGG